jgi:hypothetical protein
MTQRWADMMSDDEDMADDRRLLRVSTSTSYVGNPVQDFDASHQEPLVAFKRMLKTEDRDHSRTPPRQLKREGADIERPANYVGRKNRVGQGAELQRGTVDPVTPQERRVRGDTSRDSRGTPQRAVRSRCHTEDQVKPWRMDRLTAVHESLPQRNPHRRRAGDIPEVDDSTWQHRISQRVKQIRIGKDTPEYTLFRRFACTSRRSANCPQTPDPTERVSKRLFDSRLKRWRIELHNWRPNIPDALAAWEEEHESFQRSRAESAKVDNESSSSESTDYEGM